MESIQEQIKKYIDASDEMSFHRLKEYAAIFRPEWSNELRLNAYEYFRYMNNRILKREGVIA